MHILQNATIVIKTTRCQYIISYSVIGSQIFCFKQTLVTKIQHKLSESQTPNTHSSLSAPPCLLTRAQVEGKEIYYRQVAIYHDLAGLASASNDDISKLIR